MIITDKQLRDRDKADFYPTEPEVAALALSRITITPKTLFEPGTGNAGVWAKEAKKIWPDIVCYGCDIRDIPHPPGFDVWERASFIPVPAPRPLVAYRKQYVKNHRNAPEDEIAAAAQAAWDFAQFCHESPVYQPPIPRFDLVVGNPPFMYAEEFCWRAFEMLAPGGEMVYLLRLSFVGSKGRIQGLHAKHGYHTFSPFAPRPSFTGDGQTSDDEYAFFYWWAHHSPTKTVQELIWERRKEAPQTIPGTEAPELWRIGDDGTIVPAA